MDTPKVESGILTQRYSQLQEWLQQMATPSSSMELTPLAGDASFRRYFRLRMANQSYVLMDAPPDRESCDAYVGIAHAFKKAGICVPTIYQKNLHQGFLLLSDLGDRLYLSELTEASADVLYERAFSVLLNMQSGFVTDYYSFPVYDAALLRTELNLFVEWYLLSFLKMRLSEQQKREIERLFLLLIQNAEEQPLVCVHRDYHSRNLLVCDREVGVLDFQDALLGPVTYDIVSLLKDCYIDWPLSKVEAWVQRYYELLREEKKIPLSSYQQFFQWVEWMGLQRHLKCLGIFARLYLRDQKSGYLKEIPRVLRYVSDVCQRYTELSSLLSLLKMVPR